MFYYNMYTIVGKIIKINKSIYILKVMYMFNLLLPKNKEFSLLKSTYLWV